MTTTATITVPEPAPLPAEITELSNWLRFRIEAKYQEILRATSTPTNAPIGDALEAAEAWHWKHDAEYRAAHQKLAELYKAREAAPKAARQAARLAEVARENANRKADRKARLAARSANRPMAEAGR